MARGRGKFVLWFKDVGKDDIPSVGGKGANLGELKSAGIPVPNGFIVTADAYYYFLEKTGLKAGIAKTLKGLDPEDSKKLNFAAKEIKKHIVAAKFPDDLARDIAEAYHHMGNFPVAVRSSATAEDLPDASFAGQQATFLNIEGKEKVIKAVQDCYASLFEARAIYYRIINKFDHMKVGIAVPVQAMIESEISGILFTVDPVTGDQNKLVIEAGYGLGEAIVSGSVTPDRYLINKDPLSIEDKELNSQPWKIVQDAKGGDKHVNVPKEKRKLQKLDDEKILELAKMGIEIEKHYGKPQDTEWAYEGGKLYFVQSRPITTLNKKQNTSNNNQTNPNDQNPNKLKSYDLKPNEASEAEVLLKGAAASLGMAFGPVKIIHKPSEIDKIEKGDVLVTEMTTPDFVPAMRRATAIVTDTGGRTCHAAIVSRELGIPCVVGTGTATHALKNSQMITVDGAKGLVYKGKIATKATPEEIVGSKPTASGSALLEEVPITGTKVYVNLAEPHLAEEIAKQSVDGVGLLRAEFMIAEIGEHPRAMVEGGRGKAYVEKLAEGMRTIASAFAPRPVVYRATDFKTNEYAGLKGGEKYEPKENNPMIGYRGASRYIREPELFALEIEAMKKVRDEYDLKNLWLMIPFVRTVDEMTKVKKIVEENGLVRSPDFKLWMMCEVPSNVILLEKFIDVGIDGISIGSNDLTQLTLGADRDNQTLAEIFDERDEAIQLSLEYVIKTCRKCHITCSICGQAPSVFPEITELMVKAGTTSVSVTPDMILSTRKLIASVEKRLLLSRVVDR
ncbi:phosphoenolpyruvate synthase [Candidatus Berkelbacteria bacterium RIFOXYA2_FULL_43_10]|uniref:Phosphoenolpyruvate synthase n=1 Tax=Candidatus Berkelbacteria bacterium RIFOXYA2_FULL_43_10 TaxID=1797472 RepID=A0A1F5EA41_9BACT|nr:MAG: phosphoenolpyruvate synthase [Candidatus Berkelbacteria bacterium RIFOXYA2_FULL_43_10]